eukprot:364320-Chlamydomonas_euryale.AAC.12
MSRASRYSDDVAVSTDSFAGEQPQPQRLQQLRAGHPDGGGDMEAEDSPPPRSVGAASRTAGQAPATGNERLYEGATARGGGAWHV